MRQLPDTYNILEIQCLSDSSRLFVDRSDYDRLEEALAAKTADFDRLCKDFDRLLSGAADRELELTRIIASQRATLDEIAKTSSSTRIRRIAKEDTK